MRNRYSAEQILSALKQVELGERMSSVCRRMGIDEATFCRWEKKYRRVGVSGLQRMKELEGDNRRLRQLVKDLSLGSPPHVNAVGKDEGNGAL